MIALDASVLVAHLSPLDAHHRRASQFLHDVAGEALVAHVLTLAEVLVGGVRVGRGEEMLADIEAIGVAVAGPAEAAAPDSAALRLARLRATTALKLPDCCVLDTAVQTGAAVATLDDALAAAARRLDLALAL